MPPANPDLSGLHTSLRATSDDPADFVCNTPSQSPDRSGSGLPLILSAILIGIGADSDPSESKVEGCERDFLFRSFGSLRLRSG